MAEGFSGAVGGPTGVTGSEASDGVPTFVVTTKVYGVPLVRLDLSDWINPFSPG